jgi:hypothetical protein
MRLSCFIVMSIGVSRSLFELEAVNASPTGHAHALHDFECAPVSDMTPIEDYLQTG